MADVMGKVAVITGSTRGIGRVAARMLAAKGFKVVVTGRTLDRHKRLAGSLNQTAAEIADAGGEVLAVQADMSKPEDIKALAAQVLERFGGCDVLVNNAADVGRVAGWSLDQIELEGWNHHIAVNLTAPVLLSQALVPSMRERGGGRIINLSSDASDFNRDPGAVPGLAYPAAKAGLDLASNRMARDLKPDNIAVILLRPGFTASESVMAAFAKWSGGDPDRKPTDAHSPGVPAAVIAHLASCADPFAFVGAHQRAATLFRQLELTEPVEIKGTPAREG